MGCMSLGFLQALIVQIIIICALVACIKLLVPWLVSFTGLPIIGQVIIIICALVACIKLLVPWLVSFTGLPIIGQVIMIILWAIVAILIVYLIFALLSCLVGSGGFHLIR